MVMRRPSGLKKAAGIVLLEVLVSVVVLAFGVLGIIGLQAAAIQHTTAAKHRLDASFIANERIGRMWGQPSALADFAETNTDIKDAFPEAGLPNGTRTTEIDGQRVTVTVTWQAPTADRPSNVVVVAHIVI